MTFRAVTGGMSEPSCAFGKTITWFFLTGAVSNTRPGSARPEATGWPSRSSKRTLSIVRPSVWPSARPCRSPARWISSFRKPPSLAWQGLFPFIPSGPFRGSPWRRRPKRFPGGGKSRSRRQGKAAGWRSPGSIPASISVRWFNLRRRNR